MAVALRIDRPAASFLARGATGRLGRRIRRALSATGNRGAELSVLLTDDAGIAQLNWQFRRVQGPTDVLSFSQREGILPGGHNLLGDLVISVETAARRRKRSLEDELFVLATHGLAHLLGFDHATLKQARQMFAYERAVIRAVRRTARQAVQRRGPTVRSLRLPRRPSPDPSARKPG